MVALTAPFGRASLRAPIRSRRTRSVPVAQRRSRRARRRGSPRLSGGSNRMSRLGRALLCAAAAVALGHAPAAAQLVGHPIEISGVAGYLSADVRAGVKDAPAYAGAVAWRAYPWLALEGTAVFGTL